MRRTGPIGVHKSLSGSGQLAGAVDGRGSGVCGGLEIWADPSAYCIGATPDDDDATSTVLRCMLGDTDGLLPCPYDWR